jgi:hypothetical protein
MKKTNYVSSIIAVHGYARNWLTTWTDETELEEIDDSWLGKEFKSDVHSHRVSVYGYGIVDSQTNIFVREGLHDEAIRLLDAILKLKRAAKSPVVFIGHDLGGTLIKEVRNSNLLIPGF